MSDFNILQSVPASLQAYEGSFKAIPSIYAIELTAACDLSCPMCLRTVDMVNKRPTLLKTELLQIMLDRGDFAGSSYIELQLAGEPTIHPKLTEIIRFMKHKAHVLVGLSTHGLNMQKSGIADALCELDALTISVDSIDEDVYAKMRYPSTLPRLMENLDYFFAVCRDRIYDGGKLPFIELQLVVAPDVVAGSTGDPKGLLSLMERRGWDQFASVRTTQDCFKEMRSLHSDPAGTVKRWEQICINPFTTVNVSQDGDVVSCCYIFDVNKNHINYYGNLYENSLEEIWQSDRLRAMRESQVTGKLKDSCAKCYYYSPELIHQNIVGRLIRGRR